jgi:Pyruvate/2-oxoacid:ferredoxin oxidoreductase delta subunit
MAIRNIIIIDEEKCDGCEQCVDACAEGAIEIRDGVAKLIGEIYCDGFGACLGSCPQDALTIEQREAEDYDEEAVDELLAKNKDQKPDAEPELKPGPAPMPIHQGCPGSAMREMNPQGDLPESLGVPTKSQLSHWPIQLMLVPPAAPFLKGADLVICADCVPFAVPDFHQRYLTGHAVIVGCPKLDDLQHYFEKMKDIFKTAKPSRITILKMEVPCCNGIAQAAMMARDQIDKSIPAEVHTIMIGGGIRVDVQEEIASAG